MAANVSFPYEAIVTSDDAVVRSGTSDEFYVTNHLPRETRVVVHRHDKGGWRMISPPDNAFSLVPLSRIQKVDNNNGRIIGGDVCARVGSRVQKGFGVEQIPLRIGTRVELRPKQPAPTGWIAIQPPRGEYRWMRDEDLRPVKTAPKNPIAEIGTDAQNTVVPSKPNDPMSEFDTLAELDQAMDELDEMPPADWPLEALALGYLRLKRFHRDQADDIETSLERIAHLHPIRDRQFGLQDSNKRNVSNAPGPGMQRAAKSSPDTVASASLPPRTTYLPPSNPEDYYPTNIKTLPTANLKLPRPEPSIAETTPTDDMTAPLFPPLSVPPVIAAETTPPDSVQLQRFDAVGFLQRAIDAPAAAPAYVLLSREGEVVAYLQFPASASIGAYVGLPVGIDGHSQPIANVTLPVIAADRLTPVRFAVSTP